MAGSLARRRVGFKRNPGGKALWRPRDSGYVAGMEWNWQTVVALLIVALAALALLGAKFRRRKFDFRRDTHCGCATPAAGPRPPSIVFHARKGERSKVIVKNL